jgi:hypothetical protein
LMAANEKADVYGIAWLPAQMCPKRTLILVDLAAIILPNMQWGAVWIFKI